MSEPRQPGKSGLPWDEIAFWDFSLAVYERAPLVEACLELQDRVEADVNLVLFCCWIGASGRGPLASDDFARLSEAVSVWQRDVVAPMRGVRRRLKQPPQALAGTAARSLRERVQALEIEAERIEQMALVEVMGRKPVVTEAEHRRRDVTHNLATYLAFIAAPSDELTAAATATLVEETCGA